MATDPFSPKVKLQRPRPAVAGNNGTVVWRTETDAMIQVIVLLLL